MPRKRSGLPAPDYAMIGPAAPALLAKSETFLADEAMQLLNDLES